MKDYITPEWAHIQKYNHLDGFDGLWELKAEWFEPPNERRGGWSGVSRVELNLPGGAKEVVFLKRQENHTRRTLRAPISGEPTFAGEMKNILLLQQAGVPTMNPLYYGQRKVDGKWRAILVTRELAGFNPMDAVIDEWDKRGWEKNVSARRKLISVLAGVIHNMHENKLVHNSLHPKHVFVRLVEGRPPDVALIDLEKMRSALTVKRAMLRDLDSLNRRTQLITRTDRLRFLKAYLKTDRITGSDHAVYSLLANRRAAFLQKRESNG